MIDTDRLRLHRGAIQRVATDGPEVLLIDARSQGADDEANLRAAAQAAAAARPALCVSRSYRYPYAIVAWHHEPLGVDIERISHCDATFARSICTPSEALQLQSAQDDDAYFTSMWCSKEAIAKGLGDALRYDPRRIGAPMLWPAGRAGAWRSIELDGPPEHVVWLCWRSTTLKQTIDLP